jgi:hypothetical protein
VHKYNKMTMRTGMELEPNDNLLTTTNVILPITANFGGTLQAAVP